MPKPTAPDSPSSEAPPSANAEAAPLARPYRPSAKLAGRRGSGPLLGPLAGRDGEGAAELPTATPAPVGSLQDVLAALRTTGEEGEAKA